MDENKTAVSKTEIEQALAIRNISPMLKSMFIGTASVWNEAVQNNDSNGMRESLKILKYIIMLIYDNEEVYAEFF